MMGYENVYNRYTAIPNNGTLFKPVPTKDMGKGCGCRLQIKENCILC